MKQLLYIITFLYCCSSCHAPQNESNILELKRATSFPGGTKEMRQYFIENFIYPDSAYNNNVEGKTVICFVVNKEGIFEDVTIKKSSGSKMLDDEAYYLIETMPRWEPAINNQNKKVKQQFCLPVSFKIDK